MLQKIVTNRIKNSMFMISLCRSFVVRNNVHQSVLSVCGPLRVCTGRCGPLRECVQAGAARWENVHRPVRPAERMCTGRCGPLRECVQAGAARWECVQAGAARPSQIVYRPVRLVPLRLCTGRCGSSLSDCVQAGAARPSQTVYRPVHGERSCRTRC